MDVGAVGGATDGGTDGSLTMPDPASSAPPASTPSQRRGRDEQETRPATEPGRPAAEPAALRQDGDRRQDLLVEPVLIAEVGRSLAESLGEVRVDDVRVDRGHA